MAASPEDVAEQIRQQTGGAAVGHEGGGMGGVRGWPGGSNNFARFLHSPGSALDILAAVRLRQTTGPYATGRAMYDLAQREANAPRGTSYIDYARPSELAAMRQAEVRAQLDALDEINALTRAELERQRGQIKAAEEAARIDALHRNVRRNLGAYTGATAADVLGVAGQLFVEDVRDRRQQRERRQRILAVGRRGAAATRTVSPTAAGRTNRTGAKSTRAPVSSAPAGLAGTAQPTRARATSAGSAKSASASVSRATANTRATGKLSKAQSAVTEQGQIQRTVQRSRLGQLFTSLLSPIYPPISRVRVPVSAGLKTGPSLSPSGSRAVASTLTPTAQGLTALQAQGVGSPPPKCKCPEPKKKRPGEKACRNPVISTTVKDNIITTKRELKCPPSKPK